MAKLKGKRVLITGAAHGIGRRMADLFADAGCVLVLSDLDAEGIAEAEKEVAAKGARVLSFVVDISDKKAVDAMADQVVKELGGLDILINNAGIGHNGEMVETKIETWKKLMAVNFFGTLNHTYAFLPHMIRQGSGHIVTVSSGQAFFRLPTWGPYSVVKLALGAFSELLRIELKKFNIKVTTVYPYMINTGFYKDVEAETFGSKLSMKLLPLYSQRPETVAKIIFKAVKKQKAVEMVNVLNHVGFAMRAMPPVSNLVSSFVIRFMGKDAETLMEEADLR